MHYRLPAALLVAATVVAATVGAAPIAQSPDTTEKLDYAALAQIRDEGLNRSQMMDHISWLSDVYGPRLTGGPGIMQASDWALGKFAECGARRPAPRDLAVRQGLVACALQRAHDRAAGAAARLKLVYLSLSLSRGRCAFDKIPHRRVP